MNTRRPTPHILYVAAADARGHLMRGHLVRRLLAPLGVEVHLVTTSPAGADFLAALGDPCEVLPGGWGIPYRDGQALDRAAAWRSTRDYAAQGLVPDREALGDWGRGAALLVTDGHPAPLVAPPSGPRVVHLTSDSMWAAVLAEAAPVPFAGTGLLGLLRAGAWAEIVHGAAIDAAARGPRRRWRLPTLLAPPTRVVGGEAVVYLNPHFRDPTLASRVESAFGDLPLHAVGEGFAGRAGWHTVDPHFVDHAMGAAVLVSAPGMAAVSIARRFGVPMIALLTDQPEQRRNLAFLAGHPHVAVDLHGDLVAARRALPPALPRPDPATLVADLGAAWVHTFTSLLAAAGVHPTEIPCTTSSSTPRTSSTSLRGPSPPPSPASGARPVGPIG